MSNQENLPILSPENGLTHYLQEIRKFPLLEAGEEYMLAKAWAEHGDRQAAHKLVTSHLRLVAKIAMGYRGYGLPVADLVAEGNVGMMQAVKKFDPERGFRLATYAMWWIRAAIQEYILRSWSLVKLGTTAAQKKLFFNLRRLKGQIKAHDDGDMKASDVQKIAEALSVPEADVISMNQRLSIRDHSLQSPLRGDGEGEGEWQDWLTDDSPDQESLLADSEEADERRAMLLEAMKDLNERERDILIKRRLEEPAMTLEDLAQIYGISRERIRQIEMRAFEKLQKTIQAHAQLNRSLQSYSD